MAQFKIVRRESGYAYFTTTFIVEADDLEQAVDKVETSTSEESNGATAIDMHIEFEDESEVEFENITE